MPTTQDFIALGLSLAPDSGENKQPSELLQKADALRQKLLAGDTEPYVSELRTIAEQSADWEAACLACHTLCLYYHDIFHSQGKTDPDRALYYAEIIKTLGPDHQAMYHHTMALHFFALYMRRKGQSLDEGMTHAFEALKLGYQPTADFLTSGTIVADFFTQDTIVADVCTNWDPPTYWGVVYFAHRVRLQDPALTPFQREELESAATALLETVYKEALNTKRTGYMDEHYPLEVQRARQANPPKQDAALIGRIAKLRAQVKSHPLLERLLSLCSGFTGAIIAFLGHTGATAAVGRLLFPIFFSDFDSSSMFADDAVTTAAAFAKVLAPIILLAVLYTLSAVFFTLLPNLLHSFLDRRCDGSLVQRLGPRGVRHAAIVAILCPIGIFLLLMALAMELEGEDPSLLMSLPCLLSIFFPAISVWRRTQYYDELDKNP